MAKLTTFLMCEDALVNQKSGKWKLVGVNNGFWSTTFPLQIPQFAVFMLIEFDLTEFDAKINVKAELQNLDGGPIFGFNTNIPLPGHPDRTRNTTPYGQRIAHPLRAFMPGEYTWRFWIDDEPQEYESKYYIDQGSN